VPVSSSRFYMRRMGHVPSVAAVQHEDSRASTVSLQALSRQSGELFFHLYNSRGSLRNHLGALQYSEAPLPISPRRYTGWAGSTLPCLWLLQCHWRVHLSRTSCGFKCHSLTARFVMAILMVGTIAGAYGADDLTLVRKSDQLMTLDWRNHQTSFKSPCRVYLPLPSSSRTNYGE
jgi:hypothetical protein